MKRFGAKNKTKDFYNFSTKVQFGDIIGQDLGSDGGFDHMGIVVYTTKDYNEEIIEGKKISFLNFRIAQHSKNYNYYVNDERNGWENCAVSGCSYAIAKVNYK